MRASHTNLSDSRIKTLVKTYVNYSSLTQLYKIKNHLKYYALSYLVKHINLSILRFATLAERS